MAPTMVDGANIGAKANTGGLVLVDRSEDQASMVAWVVLGYGGAALLPLGPRALIATT